MDNTIEYVDIKTTTEETKQKCRCCSSRANNGIQLDSIIKINEGREKTYKDFLYEITQQKVIINK